MDRLHKHAWSCIHGGSSLDDKTNFRYAERCLYGYPENCIRLEAMKKALEELRASASVHGQNYEPMSHGGAGDPVATRAQRLADMETEIQRLEAVTMPIALMKRDLTREYVLPNSTKDEMGKILTLCYFGGNSNTEVAAKLGMSEKGVYRVRCSLVRMAIRCLGL